MLVKITVAGFAFMTENSRRNDFCNQEREFFSLGLQNLQKFENNICKVCTRN